MPTYQTTNPLARTNPLRSISTFRPAGILARIPASVAAAPVMPVAAPGHAFRTITAADLLQRDLANAEARVRAAIRVYDDARAGIGAANRTSTVPVMSGGRVLMPAQPFTKQRIRERKAYAFRLFNQRRGELARARRAVDIARVALGLPSLRAVAERCAVKAAVRASKRHPIAQAAFAL